MLLDTADGVVRLQLRQRVPTTMAGCRAMAAAAVLPPAAATAGPGSAVDGPGGSGGTAMAPAPEPFQDVESTLVLELPAGGDAQLAVEAGGQQVAVLLLPGGGAADGCMPVGGGGLGLGLTQMVAAARARLRQHWTRELQIRGGWVQDGGGMLVGARWQRRCAVCCDAEGSKRRAAWLDRADSTPSPCCGHQCAYTMTRVRAADHRPHCRLLCWCRALPPFVIHCRGERHVPDAPHPRQQKRRRHRRRRRPQRHPARRSAQPR